MERISHSELVERWALTYGEDGYQVRAEDVPGLTAPSKINHVQPDIEATKDQDRILVCIIDSQECLDAEKTRHDLAALDAARGGGTSLHLVVAAECASGLKERIDNWHVHADAVHVT